MHKYGPVIKMLSLVTQIGITMLTSVFLCMAIGMWIDKHFSTNLFLLFLILGIMGGIRGVYSQIHPVKNRMKTMRQIWIRKRRIS